MNETKHTPGPWTVHDSYGLCVSVDNHLVAELDWNPRDGGPLPPYAENRANARLIAAAPDLLAACKAMLTNRITAANFCIARHPDQRFAASTPEYAADCRCEAELADMIEAAIAKAEAKP